MTPLAHKLVLNSTKLIKDRFKVHGDTDDLARLPEAMCFEVSQVMSVCRWQARHETKPPTPWPTCFLPAPVTWLETYNRGFQFEGKEFDGRHGYLLIGAADNPGSFTVTSVLEAPWGITSYFVGFCCQGRFRPVEANFPDKQWWWQLTAVLAAINSPKVWAKTQHDPHAGLARKLAASRGVVGKFPLHAWHEIKIKGWVPRVERGVRRPGKSTGEVARHTVRAHPRFQCGQWLIVTSHERGNPQLGFRRARYIVEMPDFPERPGEA